MVYITVHPLCCMFCGFEQMYNDMCAFQVVLVVNNPSANAGDVRDVGLIPGLGRSPGGRHGTHSCILAWRIPRTEEPDRLQFIGSQRIRHNRSDLACTHNDTYPLLYYHTEYRIGRKIHLGFLGQSNTLILTSLIMLKILYTPYSIHPSLTPHYWQSLLFLLSP